MSLLLEGKRAFITGGTRGIGAALCEVFAREGADVAFNYGSRDDLADSILSPIVRRVERPHRALPWRDVQRILQARLGSCRQAPGSSTLPPG